MAVVMAESGDESFPTHTYLALSSGRSKRTRLRVEASSLHTEER